LFCRFQQGLRSHFNIHFYFPLLRTKKVLLRLLAMWKKIAEANNWAYIATMEVLTSPTYAHDPPPVFFDDLEEEEEESPMQEESEDSTEELAS